MDGLEVEVWDLRRMVLPPSFCEKFRPHLFGERDLLWSTPVINLHIHIVAHSILVRVTVKTI